MWCQVCSTASAVIVYGGSRQHRSEIRTQARPTSCDEQRGEEYAKNKGSCREGQRTRMRDRGEREEGIGKTEGTEMMGEKTLRA